MFNGEGKEREVFQGFFTGLAALSPPLLMRGLSLAVARGGHCKGLWCMGFSLVASLPAELRLHCTGFSRGGARVRSCSLWALLERWLSNHGAWA